MLGFRQLQKVGLNIPHAFFVILISLFHLTAMNVLRMIKLFGWEKRMNEKVAEKRDQELVWIWKRQILDLINGSLK